MLPIFHVEYTEARKDIPNSSVSYRHVYYTNKIESFVKYSTNWYPVKMTNLNKSKIETTDKCPKFTPNIDLNKEKEILYLAIIYQHYNDENRFKSKEWYQKFLPMYKQSRRHSLGQKRKVVEPLIWEEDHSFVSEKRRKFSIVGDSTTLGFEEDLDIFGDTLDASKEESMAIQKNSENLKTHSTPKKSKRPEFIMTPSKKLAEDMDAKLGVQKAGSISHKIVFPTRKAEVCNTCHLPLEPLNHQICLSRIYGVVDGWMDAYYADK